MNTFCSNSSTQIDRPAVRMNVDDDDDRFLYSMSPLAEDRGLRPPSTEDPLAPVIVAVPAGAEMTEGRGLGYQVDIL